MMRSRTLVLAVLVAVAVMLGSPRQAPAGFDTTPLIISAGVAGGVAMIYLIAIAAASREDPDFVYLVPGRGPAGDRQRPGTVRFGPACAPTTGVAPLLCW